MEQTDSIKTVGYKNLVVTIKIILKSANNKYGK